MLHRIRKCYKESASLREERGVALLTALSMLFLFSVLGTAYVGYASIELKSSKFQTRQVRARYIASGGINAAIAEIQAALGDGMTPQKKYTFQIPVFAILRGEFVAVDQKVTVEIFDESGRVNLNHASGPVLEALGMPAASVVALKAALPSSSKARKGSRWLASVEELRTTGILDARAFRKLERDAFTVYTVVNAKKPSGFLNINAASPTVLAALFNIPQQEATALAATRPFTSWQDAVTKTGRDPSTFKVQSSPAGSRAMPRELGLTSRCFRLKSKTDLTTSESIRLRVSGYAEAVVLFADDGSYKIRYWSERRPETMDAVAEVEPDDEDEGEDEEQQPSPTESPSDEA